MNLSVPSLAANEPARLSTAVSAVLTAAAAFGIQINGHPLTGVEIAGVAAATFAIANEFVRQAVTPTGKT